MSWNLFLAALLLVAPEGDDPKDARALIDEILAPQVVAAPGFPYRAKDEVRCSGDTRGLKQVSRKKNRVTDEHVWYANNDLVRPAGALDTGYEGVPQETRWGLLAFFRSSEPQ